MNRIIKLLTIFRKHLSLANQMKKLIASILSLLLVHVLYSQNISFEWQRLLGQEGKNKINCIISDTNNNIIIGGYFENSIEIDGNILNSNGNTDYLIAKYDVSGNNIWYIHGGGELDDYISDITLVNNRTFILGVFSDSIFLENGVYVADSLTDLFLGEIIDDHIYGIDKFSGKGLVNSGRLIASDSVLYITGGYEGEIILGNDTVVSTGWWDYGWPYTDSTYIYNQHVLFVKYNLQTNLEWFKNYKDGSGLSMAADGSGNLYLIASCFGDCEIENGIEISDHLFLTKYDKNGHYLWHITAGPVGQIVQPYDLICIDNYLYITGQIAGNDLYIGNETVVETSWYDAFLCKMDTSGSIVWFNQIGVGDWRNNIGPHHNCGNVIKCIGDTIYLAGHFLQEIDFGTTVLNSLGAYDLFYAKYLKNGDFIDAGQYLVPGWSSASDIVIDTLGKIYIAGFSYENNTSSNEPMYILFGKIDSLTNIPTTIGESVNERVIAYPNPTNSSITLDFKKENDREIQIIDIQGRTIFHAKHYERTITIDVKELNAGLYLIAIFENNRIKKLKFNKTQ